MTYSPRLLQIVKFFVFLICATAISLPVAQPVFAQVSGSSSANPKAASEKTLSDIKDAVLLPDTFVKQSGIWSFNVSNWPTSWTTNDGGTQINGVTMPSGGIGLTGWMSAIYQKVAANADTTETLWVDSAGLYFRKQVTNTVGVLSERWVDATGTLATPTLPVKPASLTQSRVQSNPLFTATSAGTGYAIGDTLGRMSVFDVTNSTPVVVSSFWSNITTGAILSTPPAAGSYANNSATDASLQQLHNDMLAPTPAGNNTIGKVGLIGGNALPVSVAAGSTTLTDIASTTVTASGNSGVVASDAGQSLAAVITVASAPTGTLPTLDVILEETFDGGVTFQDIYHLERITVAGSYIVPNMLMHGQRRWKWVVGGTTPSFTFTIKATRGVNPVQAIRRFFVRGLDTTAMNTFTPRFNIEGFKFISFGAKMNSGGTNPILQFQISPDDISYAFFGTTLTAGTGGLSFGSWTAYGALVKYARIVVQTSGAMSSNDYIVINASN